MKNVCFCSLFSCVADKTKETLCCACCPEKESCVDACLNSPNKCNLATTYKESKASK